MRYFDNEAQSWGLDGDYRDPGSLTTSQSRPSSPGYGDNWGPVQRTVEFEVTDHGEDDRDPPVKARTWIVARILMRTYVYARCNYCPALGWARGVALYSPSTAGCRHCHTSSGLTTRGGKSPEAGTTFIRPRSLTVNVCRLHTVCTRSERTHRWFMRATAHKAA